MKLLIIKIRLNKFPSGWIPTIEYTAHLRARPDKEIKNPYFRVRFQSKHVVNGLLEEDGEIWHPEDEIIWAQSRQLARYWEPKK